RAGGGQLLSPGGAGGSAEELDSGDALERCAGCRRCRGRWHSVMLDPSMSSGQVACGSSAVPGWKRRSRRLLVTTNTERIAMAVAAMRGLRKPRAASGMAAVL